jgi:hypothetical protein
LHFFALGGVEAIQLLSAQAKLGVDLGQQARQQPATSARLFSMRRERAMASNTAGLPSAKLAAEDEVAMRKISDS